MTHALRTTFRRPCSHGAKTLSGPDGNGERLLPWRILPLGCLLLAAAGSICGQSGQGKLDRKTALRLLEGKSAERIDFHCQCGPVGPGDPRRDALQKLAEARLLICNAFDSVLNCHADARRFPSGEVVAGNMVAKEITGVSQTGTATAEAEVILSFQATPYYSEYKSEFDRVEVDGLGVRALRVENMARRTKGEAKFKLFDDGWRLDDLAVKLIQ